MIFAATRQGGACVATDACVSELEAGMLAAAGTEREAAAAVGMELMEGAASGSVALLA